MLKGVNCISRSVSCSLIYKKTKDTSEHHHIFVLFELFLKILRQAQLCPTMHHSPVLTSSRLSFSLLRISSSSSLALSRSCRRRCHSFSCSLSALLSSSLCLWGTHGNKNIYIRHIKELNTRKLSTCTNSQQTNATATSFIWHIRCPFHSKLLLIHTAWSKISLTQAIKC